jgi:hypothetical protein
MGATYHGLVHVPVEALVVPEALVDLREVLLVNFVGHWFIADDSTATRYLVFFAV